MNYPGRLRRPGDYPALRIHCVHRQIGAHYRARATAQLFMSAVAPAGLLRLTLILYLLLLVVCQLNTHWLLT